MKKSVAVPLVVTSMLATSLTGCAPAQEDPQYQGICVDPETEQRIDDDQCDDDEGRSGGFGGVGLWYFFLLGSRFPAVGAPLAGYRSGADYVRSVPRDGAVVRGGAAANGGRVSPTSVSRAAGSGGKVSTVSRGGLGGSSRGIAGS